MVRRNTWPVLSARRGWLRYILWLVLLHHSAHHRRHPIFNKSVKLLGVNTDDRDHLWVVRRFRDRNALGQDHELAPIARAVCKHRRHASTHRIGKRLLVFDAVVHLRDMALDER